MVKFTKFPKEYLHMAIHLLVALPVKFKPISDCCS